MEKPSHFTEFYQLSNPGHRPVLLAASRNSSVATPNSRITSAITISVSPTPVSLVGAQTQQFNATLTGTINTAVTWSINPALGTINAAGFYSAPNVVTSAQTVTVTAVSAADTTKSATATINLVPVSVSLTPSTATLTPAGTQQFTATVAGTSNTGVTWGFNPSVGTLNNGLYTAPAQITSAQTITVTVTSMADSTKSASAVINLQPPAASVAVSVTPATVTLQASQTQQFSASVTGSSNTAVTWALNPTVGTISGGFYTAPSFVSTAQTITVTATSVADTTKSATAQISLQPTTAVTISPGSASLGASQTQQFTATVSANSNTAVNWSLNPNVGTISATGLYTAPATISSQQQVTVVATSAADNTKSGQVTVTLNPPSGPVVTLPIEVMGPNGTTVSTVVNAPTVPAGTNTMQLRIHGLKYDTEASLQVNGSAWVPLNTATVTLLGNAAVFGGIGGGFATLDLTVPLPSGAIVAGNNTINFRFNATDGRTSGFRVLSLNFLDLHGNSLVPATAFVQDDPTTWQPPFSDAGNIAAGQALWNRAALTVPQSTGPVPIQAKCGSCHTQDGRDLKYFNYSNNSIIARSVFHGLTTQQGQQIASYIRTLPVNNPGRPWNPPYQPGPGLDEAPVANWAAGAGLDAILPNSPAQMNDVFPGGIQASTFSAQGTLNQREIRVPFQLMDWNEWLPAVHPMDAFGATFTNSTYNTAYQALRANLKVGDPVTYGSAPIQVLFNNFLAARDNFGSSVVAAESAPGFWTAYNTAVMYSIPLWGLVKSWEINNEFQLEGIAQAYYGPQGSPRAWVGNFPFVSSPNILQIPPTNFKNGKQSTHDYVGFVWYQLQLILNDSNKQQSYQYPIDWGYVYGTISGMATMVPPTTALQYEWMIRSLQIMNNGKGPEFGANGWNWSWVNFLALIMPPTNTWNGESLATRVALANDFVQAWLAVVTQFTPQQFYAGAWATATQVPSPGYENTISGGRFIDSMWYSIPQLRNLGVSQTLINQLAAWSQTVWPLANWSATTTATCTTGSWPICSTEQ